MQCTQQVKNREFYYTITLMTNRLYIVFVFCLCLYTISCSRSDRLYTEQEADLVIYSPHYKENSDFIIREFRQRTGYTVRIVYQGTSELLSRLETEHQNQIYAADVFWGGGIETLESMVHLFEPYRSPELEYINIEYCDPAFYWLGFSVMTMVMVYNTELVPVDMVPDSWESLLDPFFYKRIIMPDPLRSGSAYSLLNAVLTSVGYEDGWSLISRIKAAAGKDGISALSSSVNSEVISGGFFVGLTSEDAALPEIEHGKPLAVIYPKEGTIAVPDGVALIRNAPHQKVAKEFIDFVLSYDVQSLVAKRWYRRSVRSDVILPVGAKPFDSVYVLPYKIFIAAQRRNEILSCWKAL